MDTDLSPDLIDAALLSSLAQQINLGIALATVLACTFVVITTAFWWSRLDSRRTNLKPFVLAIAIAKAAIGFWASTALFQLLWLKVGLPSVTLPARVGLMIAPMIQVWVISRVRAQPSTEGLPVPFATTPSYLRKVVVLEDDELVAGLYCEVINDAGFACEVATTGEGALAILSKFAPDMLVVDIRLPGMNGVQFLKLARAAGYAGPAIAVSGAMSVMDPCQLRDFVATLQKPFRMSELAAAVRNNIRPDPDPHPDLVFE